MKLNQEVEDLIGAELPGLRRFAFALTRRADLADDLVQDSLEKAVKRAHQWRKRGSFRFWLRAIVYRTFLNQRRAQQRRGISVPIDLLAEFEGTESPSLVSELREVLRRMDTLPADQHDVLVLVAIEGFTYAEAATLLSVPVGTVRSRLARARVALNEQLESPARPHLVRVK
ncbi:MAG: RNA polymerase sigma factor [Azospirillaceae bacterium]